MLSLFFSSSYLLTLKKKWDDILWNRSHESCFSITTWYNAFEYRLGVIVTIEVIIINYRLRKTVKAVISVCLSEVTFFFLC